MQLRIPSLAPADYADAWLTRADQAAFGGGFTRTFAGERRGVQLEALLLQPREHAQLAEASAALGHIFSRVTEWVQHNPVLLPVLGIPPLLAPWVRLAPGSGPFSLLARLDWLQDRAGRWWCIECNADTPAGLPEATVWQSLCHDLHPGTSDPNQPLLPLLGAALRQALPGTAGFVTAPGQVEDWENLLLAHQAYGTGSPAVAGGLPVVQSGALLVSGTPVDSLYKFYPGDWLVRHPDWLAWLTAGRPCVNPGRALIAQSKGLFALLWHLVDEQQFLTAAERDWIGACIPRTALEPLPGPWVAKPYWEREGGGIRFGSGAGPAADQHAYQTRIDAAALACPVHSGRAVWTEAATPVVGVYLVAGEPTGYFARIGGTVTDRSAHVLPVYVEQRPTDPPG